jgi:hypothetical protein
VAPVNDYVDEPLNVKAGESFVTTCRWYNSTDQEIVFPSEMWALITASRNVQSRNLSYWAVKSLVPTRYDRMSHCL